MEQYKTCKSCGQTQPLSNFHSAKANLDGHRNICKSCTKAKDAARYQANIEEYRAKGLAYYYANKEHYAKTFAKKYSENRDAIAEKRKMQRLENIWQYKKQERAMYEKHKEKKRAQSKIWTKNNPDKTRAQNQRRRARLANAKTFAVTPREIKKLYESACLFCGHQGRIDLDHAIPLSRGGDHSIGNLIPLCDNCNSTKYNKTIMEWRVYRIRIGNPLPLDKGKVL
jgi:5-methylcytosine-specific restriction endonuclease McrA